MIYEHNHFYFNSLIIYMVYKNGLRCSHFAQMKLKRNRLTKSVHISDNVFFINSQATIIARDT